MRRCSACHTEYEATEAHFPRRGDGRLRGQCLPCFRSRRNTYIAGYRAPRREVLRAARQAYHVVHRDKCNEQSREWQKRNPEAACAAVGRYRKTSAGRLFNNVGAQMRQHFERRGHPIRGRVIRCLPFRIRDLMAHLERQFKPGMTWQNYGAWEIDHIRPVSSFTFTQPSDEGFGQCWALDNLQPLWAAENAAKGAKYEEVT